MKPKILTTGLSGLVGSRIFELLSNKFDFQDLAYEDGFDITKIETIEKEISLSPAKVLIHLAAFTDVNKAWEERGNKNGMCYQINVVGTKNIAQLCRKYNKFLIHFSTDFVFDGRKKGVYTEKDKPEPIEWYGQTKYWAEEEVKKSGCDYCILRIAYPFRAYYKPKLDLVRKIINGLRTKNLPPMFSDQIITPTFIDDIAFGLKIILEKRPLGVFHFVGSTFLSPYLLAKKVAKVFNFPLELVKRGSLKDYLENNPGVRPYQKNLALSNKKIKNLGVKIKTIDAALLSLKRQLEAK